MEFLRKLFETDFMPHGHCYFWNPEIVWTNAISDGIIAIAYFTIPLSLIHIVRTRTDFKFYWLLVLFATFILGCGATHVMDVINIWNPVYRLDSTFRAITAIASVGTAIMLIKITPTLLLIPNPETFQRLNEDLKSLNQELEKRVNERTEQLRINEQELRLREHQLRLITNAIPAFISYIDKDLVYRFTNDRYKSLPSLATDLTNKSMKELLGEETFSKSEKYIAKVLEGEAVSFETDLKLKDGGHTFLQVNYIPDKDDYNEVKGFVVLGVDLSERIKYEKSLEEKNDQLVKINTDLDNFIYTASHDLKAPISNLEGLLTTIYEETKDKCDQEVLGLFQMMKTSIDRLKTIISELTEISQIQKEREVQSETINIRQIIEEFMIDYKDQIDSNEVKIDLDIQANELIFSKKNFRSVLYNLLSNAIKYRSKERTPFIKIHTGLVDKNCFMLSVQDNGLGLDEKQKDKIFEMFKRMHDHVEGTGVGLYIVKRIIENVKGTIKVESERGRGSIFRIYFPQ